jgi:hypothetical protein
MIRDREQPLNPPGIDAPDRKIVRQYIPMREYDEVNVNGYFFIVCCEVESYGPKELDMRVLSGYRLRHLDNFECEQKIPLKFIDSFISRSGDTWRTLIEREICRQAALLPGTAWEVEYDE